MKDQEPIPTSEPEFPHGLKPMRVKPVEVRPQHIQNWLNRLKKNWIVEPKWNGLRALIFINGQGIKIVTRNGVNVTKQYPELHQGLGLLREENENLILDGELTYLDGKTEEQRKAAAARITSNPARALTSPCTYRAFDMPFRQDQNLTRVPLIDRKRQLTSTVSPTIRELGIKITPYRVRNHAEYMLAIRDAEKPFEGFVVKRNESIYVPGAISADWLAYNFRR